jgi:hypothetical protein
VDQKPKPSHFSNLPRPPATFCYRQRRRQIPRCLAHGLSYTFTIFRIVTRLSIYLQDPRLLASGSTADLLRCCSILIRPLATPHAPPTCRPLTAHKTTVFQSSRHRCGKYSHSKTSIAHYTHTLTFKVAHHTTAISGASGPPRGYHPTSNNEPPNEPYNTHLHLPI